MWKPSTAVGQNEHIGRRLFQRQDLKGAVDQTRPAKTFELYHFEERRDREISLDRLGASSVDRKVRGYLNSRAHAAATFLREMSFTGWAVVRAKELINPPKGPPLRVIASPISAKDGNELSENNYHAHVEMPANYESYETAMHLKIIFERNYRFEAASPPTGEGNSAQECMVIRLLKRAWNTCSRPFISALR